MKPVVNSSENRVVTTAESTEKSASAVQFQFEPRKGQINKWLIKHSTSCHITRETCVSTVYRSIKIFSYKQNMLLGTRKDLFLLQWAKNSWQNGWVDEICNSLGGSPCKVIIRLYFQYPTLAASLNIHHQKYQHTSGVHMPVGNLNIFRGTFLS
jgi:hypothetical protein